MIIAPTLTDDCSFFIVPLAPRLFLASLSWPVRDSRVAKYVFVVEFETPDRTKETRHEKSNDKTNNR